MDAMVSEWRLVVDGPQTGHWNMAVDEALLEAACRQGAACSNTLRFYCWQPSALSLGRSQSLAVVDTAACRRLGIDIVRRPTGGRCVLHDQELTYSLVMPVDLAESIVGSYRRLSAAITRALAGLGISAILGTETATPGSREQPRCGPGFAKVQDCWMVATSADLTAGGRKIMGAAQLRRGNYLLQHGAIKLAPSTLDIRDFVPGAGPPPATLWEQLRDLDPFKLELIAGITTGDGDGNADRRASWAKRIGMDQTGLALDTQQVAMGATVNPSHRWVGQMRETLARAIASQFGAAWKPVPISLKETEIANLIAARSGFGPHLLDPPLHGQPARG